MAGEDLGRLRRTLSQGNRYRRCAAAYAIATRANDPDAHEAIPELMAALADRSADVRWWAVHALGEMSAIPTVPEAPLLRAASDRDPDVRDVYAQR